MVDRTKSHVIKDVPRFPSCIILDNNSMMHAVKATAPPSSQACTTAAEAVTQRQNYSDIGHLTRTDGWTEGRCYQKKKKKKNQEPPS